MSWAGAASFLRRFDLRCWLIPCFAAALCYAFAHAASMGYVLWDDDVLIQNNAILQLPFGAALRASFGGMYHGDYLPLTMLSYWCEIALFGMNPAEQHTVNLLLHLTNIVLLARLLKIFPEIRSIASWLLMLFALHPVQVESVAWISERKGLLASAFYLAALIFAFQNGKAMRGQWLARVGYVFFFALALLAKTGGIFLPLWVILVQRLREGLPWRSLLARHGVALLVCAALSVVRFQAYALALPDLGETIWQTGRLLQLPIVVLTALGFYLRVFFYPAQLAIIYPKQQEFGDFSAELVGGLIFLTFCVYHVIRVMRRPSSASAATAWFAYFPLFALVTLAPVLQIVPRLNFVNDRYLYLPVIGLGGMSLLLVRSATGWPACHWPTLFSRPFLPRLSQVALLVLLAGMAHERTAVWNSNFSLWSDAAAKAPTSGIAHGNFGLALLERGEIAEAAREFQEGIQYGKADGTAENACNSLALIYGSSKKYPQMYRPALAIALLRQGIDLAPRAEETYVLRFNLILELWETGERALARQAARELDALLAANVNQRYDYLRLQVASLQKTLDAGDGNREHP